MLNTLSTVDDGIAPSVATDSMPRHIELPAIVQGLWAVFGMDSFIRYCSNRYTGESVLIAKVPGLGEVVNVIDPQLIREIFNGDSDVLRAGEINARLLSRFGSSSVIVLDGEPHLRSRRMLLPPFHGEAATKYADLIEELTVEEIGRWPVGKEFALWPRMRALTLEVILRVVIGVRDEWRRRQLTVSLLAFTRGGLFAMLAEARLPWIRQIAAGRRLLRTEARARGDELLYEEIAEHRGSPGGRDDILATLVAARDENGQSLSDKELHDHVLTVLAGGHDTSAAALAWCFERVLQHPEVLARCCRTEFSDDEYLTAVVNETLRIRPPVDAVWRKLSAPCELGGYRFPANTIIAASIIGVQRSPDLYRDPMRFTPERFLSRPIPYTFIPFGGGTRRCLGASFAMMEIKTVLRTVLRHVELRPVRHRDERPSRMHGIGIVPARGVQVVVTGKT
jgi:cytochrome P450